jgi:hypothetical protein
MRDHTLVVIALIGVLLLLGFLWYGEKPTPPRPPVTSGTPVGFIALYSGEQSSITTRTNYVITTADELRALWKLIETNGAAVPTIDFTKDVIIAVFAGEKPTTGYSVAVTKITDTQERTVTIELKAPGPTCLAGEAVTTPFEILQVSRTELPLTHEDTATTTGCI